MNDLLYDKETYEIRGAIFEVYRVMGNGFLESVYQECLEIEFRQRGIFFEAQKEIELCYKDVPLEKRFKPDFLCYGKIILEIKAIKEITDDHRAQLFNYLKAGKLRLGLLVNFGSYPKATIERIVI